MTRLHRTQLQAIAEQQRAGVPPHEVVVPAAPARKPRNNEESRMQRALVRWFDLNAANLGSHPLCLMSIPNGGNGDARRGSIMKAEGQRKGAPDLLLAVARPHLVENPATGEQWFDVFHGLFLELKTPKGRLSPEQEVYHEVLAKNGYRVIVIRSLLDGINEITTYLTK